MFPSWRMTPAERRNLQRAMDSRDPDLDGLRDVVAEVNGACREAAQRSSRVAHVRRIHVAAHHGHPITDCPLCAEYRASLRPAGACGTCGEPLIRRNQFVGHEDSALDYGCLMANASKVAAILDRF